MAVLLISQNTSAGWLPPPLDILEEKVFDGDWKVSDGVGKPIKNIKSDGYICGWIDIVGFREMCNMNNVNYVNGSPRDFAIVKRDAWYTTCDGMVVVSFTSTLSIVDENGTTTAIQYTEFHWKKKVCVLVCHWKHHYEYQTITYSVESPETFNNTIDEYEITITCYNNSVTPYTLIYTPPRWNIIKQSVTYRGNTASWHNLTGMVDKNSRGTENVKFLNETGFDVDEDETITRRAEYFVINEAPLNWSLLDIHVYTPYVDNNSIMCNATIYNSEPSDFVAWKLLLIVLGILSTFLVGIGIVCWRR